MSEPLTPEEEALLRESCGPDYPRLPMPERTFVVRLLDTLTATRKLADEGLADGLRPDGFLLTDEQLDDRDNAIHPDSRLARARSGLVLVRTGSGGVFQDGTTNTPAIDFPTRNLADEGLAGETADTDPLWRVAEAAGALQAAWDAVNAPTAKVEDYSRLDDAYDKAGADLRKALAALDATVKETP